MDLSGKQFQLTQPFEAREVGADGDVEWGLGPDSTRLNPVIAVKQVGASLPSEFLSPDEFATRYVEVPAP